MLLIRKLPRVTFSRLADGEVGLIGGFVAGLDGLSGPALTLWRTLCGWDKDGQRAVS